MRDEEGQETGSGFHLFFSSLIPHPSKEPRCTMKTTAMAHPRRMSLAWSAASRAARLSIFGLIGWLWFLSSDDSASKAVSLVAVLALAALVGITWYASRARADRRWRAALDRYARQEEAKGTHSRRNSHARPQS